VENNPDVKHVSASLFTNSQSKDPNLVVGALVGKAVRVCGQK